MTHPTESPLPIHPRATLIGALLAAAPLVAGLLAAVAGLSGRFGGPGNSFTAFWYVAAAAVPSALAGVAVLVLSHLGDGALRRLAEWSALALGGWGSPWVRHTWPGWPAGRSRPCSRGRWACSESAWWRI